MLNDEYHDCSNSSFIVHASSFDRRTRMFLLHERTRKSLCKLGFLTLCLLPTCAVALWAAVRNGDHHRALCEAELSRLLRLTVTLGDVAHPEPGVVRYTDFLITNPEMGTQIASA